MVNQEMWTSKKNTKTGCRLSCPPENCQERYRWYHIFFHMENGVPHRFLFSQIFSIFFFDGLVDSIIYNRSVFPPYHPLPSHNPANDVYTHPAILPILSAHLNNFEHVQANQKIMTGGLYKSMQTYNAFKCTQYIRDIKWPLHAKSSHLHFGNI